MGNDEDGLSGRAKLLQDLGDLQHMCSVQAAGRLIEQNDLPAGSNRRCNRDPLLLTAG